MKRAFGVLGLVTVACAGSGSNSPSDAGTSPRPVDGGSDAGTGPGEMIWFVGKTTLDLLSSLDGGPDIVEAFFNVQSTFVFVTANTVSNAPPRSSPAMTFTAVHSFSAACGDGGSSQVTGLVEGIEAGLPTAVRAVLYDNESWCFTPSTEKADAKSFARAEATAAAAIARADKLALAAPAQDIVRDMSDDAGANGTINDRYLALDLPGLAAANADVFEIQSQGLEARQDLFVPFVTAAANRARAVNPKVEVLAGLSTNPSNGVIPSSFSLCQLVFATRPVVDGYWLNVPKQSAYCPKCSADPHADVALNLLRQLAAARCDPSAEP
jgi:hypothetical protein